MHTKSLKRISLFLHHAAMDSQAALNSLNEACGSSFIKGLDLDPNFYYKVLGAGTMKTKYGPRVALTIWLNDDPSKDPEERILCLPPRYNSTVKKDHIKRLMKDGNKDTFVACTGTRVFGDLTSPMYSFKQEDKGTDTGAVASSSSAATAAFSVAAEAAVAAAVEAAINDEQKDF